MRSRSRHNACRVLLSEGSSLSCRQTLYALGPLGYAIDVCDPQPLFCLARYSRYVGTVHRCPSFGQDPIGYLHFLIELLRAQPYDVLLPTHDQVYLFARVRELLRGKIGLPVPEFAAIQRLQGKVEFIRLLDELSLPHPPTHVVRTRSELEAAVTIPCYIKQDYSTAGCGVWRVHDLYILRSIVDGLDRAGLLGGEHDLLVQRPQPGTLCVVQAAFQEGRLIAAHCYESRALGVGGSARARVSVDHPRVREQIGRLGGALSWHGAMAIDYLHDEVTDEPSYIDANPRIGETVNATLSGVNLAQTLVRIALDEQCDSLSQGRAGVQTHSVVMSLLAKGEDGARRRDIVRELAAARRGEGVYERSEDELTRPKEDPLSLLPAAVVVGRLLWSPRQAERIVRGTVSNYALTESAARSIRELDLAITKN
jgi:predicted ATP-grasp superfamily ATP-dependent carboligase